MNGSCVQVLREGPVSVLSFRFVYPCLLAVSLVGNVGNVIIYRHKFLSFSPTVRMLTGKAVANVLSWMAFIPIFLYSNLYPTEWVNDENEALRRADPENDFIPRFYYFHRQHMFFVCNFFASVAVWLTVAVIVDNYILVAFPVHAKRISSLRNANLAIGLTLPLSAALHTYWLVCYEVETLPCPHDPRRVVYVLNDTIYDRQSLFFTEIYGYLQVNIYGFLNLGPHHFFVTSTSAGAITIYCGT